MQSSAYFAFQRNCKDVQSLLKLHVQLGGELPGRRYGLEVLNKSAIVLITAFWEAYCEDIAAEGLAHLVKYAKAADKLPEELRKQVSAELRKQAHDLEIWKLADNGWRQYLTKRLEEMRAVRNRKLNTPKTENINALFLTAVGIPDVSRAWSWAKMPANRASAKLDGYITLRGAIAHRGSHSKSVRKGQAEDYFALVQKLASISGGQVNSHVFRATGRRLWRRARRHG
jgi:hypothetical protein